MEPLTVVTPFDSNVIEFPAKAIKWAQDNIFTFPLTKVVGVTVGEAVGVAVGVVVGEALGSAVGGFDKGSNTTFKKLEKPEPFTAIFAIRDLESAVMVLVVTCSQS